MKHHLKVLLGETLATEADAPLPEKWGVLYARPNPDGSRKMCANCIMWVAPSQQCTIHDPDLSVPEKAVCGYHIYGAPTNAWMEHPGIQRVDPNDSGLEQTDEGTSCNNCRFFDEGYCTAVIDTYGATAQVDPMGCCARWEG